MGINEILVGINEYAYRHNSGSMYSAYDGSWDDLIDLVVTHLPTMRAGYREGVVLVRVPPDGFSTNLALVTESTILTACVERRCPEEEHYIQVYAIGEKRAEAKLVDIVLYSHAVLEEDGDASTDAVWEIVTILASPDDEVPQMAPIAMVRNYLHEEGGTIGDFEAMDFVKSIKYSNKYVPILVTT